MSHEIALLYLTSRFFNLSRLPPIKKAAFPHPEFTCLLVFTSHCLNSTQSNQCKVTYPRAKTDTE